MTDSVRVMWYRLRLWVWGWIGLGKPICLQCGCFMREVDGSFPCNHS